MQNKNQSKIHNNIKQQTKRHSKTFQTNHKQQTNVIEARMQNNECNNLKHYFKHFKQKTTIQNNAKQSRSKQHKSWKHRCTTQSEIKQHIHGIREIGRQSSRRQEIIRHITFAFSCLDGLCSTSTWRTSLPTPPPCQNTKQAGSIQDQTKSIKLSKFDEMNIID